MFGNLLLKFQHDWLVYWFRLGISAAVVDGPVNDEEKIALYRDCRRLCESFGVNIAEKLFNAFAYSPVDPEGLRNRIPKQDPRFLLMEVQELLPVMCADGLMNEGELTWLVRFQTSAGLEIEPMRAAASL